MLVRDSAENCGGSAVALIDKVDNVLVVQVVVWVSRSVEVPQIQFIALTEDTPVASRSSTSLSWRRGSFQLQHVDKVIDVRCAGPASSSAVCEETVEIHSCSPSSSGHGR